MFSVLKISMGSQTFFSFLFFFGGVFSGCLTQSLLWKQPARICTSDSHSSGPSNTVPINFALPLPHGLCFFILLLLSYPTLFLPLMVHFLLHKGTRWHNNLGFDRWTFGLIVFIQIGENEIPSSLRGHQRMSFGRQVNGGASVISSNGKMEKGMRGGWFW